MAVLVIDRAELLGAVPGDFDRDLMKEGG